jgi:hypothetical protein
MSYNNIYEMKLHEEMNIGLCWSVLRVPGGWIYTNSASNSKFIPFDNEFMEEEYKKEDQQ